jgi:hypothetical protein
MHARHGEAGSPAGGVATDGTACGSDRSEGVSGRRDGRTVQLNGLDAIEAVEKKIRIC